MTDTALFNEFLGNLAIGNGADIAIKYANITQRLNTDFWDSDSDTARSLQIGSYGRGTAIDGVSDLDMVFELPPAERARYNALAGNGPSTMLQDVRRSLLKRYPESEVRADGQVVGVTFSEGYRVEVLPAFRDQDGNYWHGDTNDGGRWKLTKPRPEIAAVNALNATTGGVLKDACRMMRAWKNRAGVGIGGLLIDTLTYNFFQTNAQFHNIGRGGYPAMLLALFEYLASQDEEQTYWAAPGSGQRVRRKAMFQAKAKKAAARCAEAMLAATESARAALWRQVFGRPFPKPVVAKADPFDAEEFIEDRFAVDIRYDLELDCEVRQGNTLDDLLRRKLRRRQRLPIGRHLRFFVANTTVPGAFEVYWKVRNRGPEAARRRMLRGEISKDTDGKREKIESTSFEGDHYVEAYVVKDRVVVALGRIAVPI